MSFVYPELSIHPSWNVYLSYLEQDYFQTIPVTYKCRWGYSCENTSCSHVHPGQAGYRSAPYYQNNIPCQYESETSACKLKCGQSNGKYCPFKHCEHKSMEHIAIQCPRPDCQRHCPHCI